MSIQVKTELINNYRKENNLTVKQFCKKCNISQQTYYRFIHGHLHIRITVALKIIKTLNTTYSDLFEILD